VGKTAAFSVDKRDDAHLLIRDLGPWTERLTVTNDAERVVRSLYADGLLRDGQRLLYYDSDDVLDEIVHEHGEFVCFKAVRAEDLAWAGEP
jgi:hypothetical protein